jgi:glutathione peroxidase
MFNKLKLIIIIFMILFTNNAIAKYDKLAYDFSFINLNGDKLNLADYKNKVIVVVNVASQCGFTNQYDDLQKVWDKYEKKGLVIIGVPSNDFGSQEPGSNQQIKDFCETKFGITFPMVEKVSVKGDKINPFYNWAKKNYGKSAIPKWNFHKIIIGKDGKVAETFSSMTNPSSGRFTKKIEELINN